MATGLEMMLGNMLRGMGLDPEEIGKLATGMGEGLAAMLESQARIERKLDRLLRRTESLAPQSETEDNDGYGRLDWHDPERGSGDGGNAVGNGDGGTDAGAGDAPG